MDTLIQLILDMVLTTHFRVDVCAPSSGQELSVVIAAPPFSALSLGNMYFIISMYESFDLEKD